MLILQTSKDDLLRPLQTVTGLVEHRHSLSMLLISFSNLLFDSKSDSISDENKLILLNRRVKFSLVSIIALILKRLYWRSLIRSPTFL